MKECNTSNSKQPQSAEDLLSLIQTFIYLNKKTLKSDDFFALTKIIRQLSKQKDNLPNKVLRPMKNKFEQIRQQYQR